MCPRACGRSDAAAPSRPSWKLAESVNYGDGDGADDWVSHPYAYYENGRKRSFTGPDQVPYEYAYDGANRLAEIRFPVPGAGPGTEPQSSRSRYGDY